MPPAEAGRRGQRRRTREAMAPAVRKRRQDGQDARRLPRARPGPRGRPVPLPVEQNRPKRSQPKVGRQLLHDRRVRRARGVARRDQEAVSKDERRGRDAALERRERVHDNALRSRERASRAGSGHRRERTPCRGRRQRGQARGDDIRLLRAVAVLPRESVRGALRRVDRHRVLRELQPGIGDSHRMPQHVCLEP